MSALSSRRRHCLFSCRTISKSTLCYEESLFLPSKAVDYINILEIVVQNTGQSMPQPQNMQKCKRPLENGLQYLFILNQSFQLNTNPIPSQLFEDFFLLSPTSIIFHYTMSLWHILYCFFLLQFPSHFSAYPCNKTTLCISYSFLICSYIYSSKVFISQNSTETTLAKITND